MHSTLTTTSRITATTIATKFKAHLHHLLHQLILIVRMISRTRTSMKPLDIKATTMNQKKRLSTSPLLANMASGRIHCAWKLTPLNGQCFMIKTMPGLSLSWTLIAEAVRGSFLSGRNSSPKKALAHLMSNLATLTFPERSTRT